MLCTAYQVSFMWSDQ